MLDVQTSKDGRIRVALILYRDDASVGGSLRVAQLIGNHLDTTRVDPHFIFSYGGPGPVTAESRIPVHFVNSKGPGDLGGWVRMRRLIRDLRPKILHFLNPVFWANLALWDWHGPRINHLHGPLPEQIHGFRNRLVFGAFRRSMTRNICVSKQVEHQALKIGAARTGSLCTIYNGIECAAFQDLSPLLEARDELGLPKDAYILGMICRLVPEKGCLDGIRLMSHLPPDYHFAICGTGPLAEELKRIVATIGLQARVHFLGSRDSVQVVYAAIDNLLFLSKTETFGLVIAEAMASRVPVVGVAGDGGYSDPEYPLVTSDNALLLRPDKLISRDEPVPDPLLVSLAQAVISLRNSPEARSAMTLRAQEWVKAHFEIQGRADDLADLYRSLV